MRLAAIVRVVGFFLLAAGVSAAQRYPILEVPVGFSFVNVHPAVSDFSSFNVFGGGGGVVYNVTPWIGIKADLMGYTQGGKEFVSEGHEVLGPFSGNLFTYLFGLQVKKHSGKLQPFGEALFGGAYANLYANLCKVACGGMSGSNNGFAMEYGLGLDVPIRKSIQFRPVEVDYLYTRLGAHVAQFFPFTTKSQNNFKYVAGVNFTFGGK